MNSHARNLLELSGWILFLICSVFFIISGVRNNDLLVTAGSIVFFIACLFFLIPLFFSLKSKSKITDG